MKGLYTGSFDPWTKGHEDILLQALPLFDHIVILICDNPLKKHMFSKEERVHMLKCLYEGNKKVVVAGLITNFSTVSFAKSYGADYLIRGLRSVSDFEYELQIASMNKLIDKKINTMFFTPKVENQFISSSMVREFISVEEDYSPLVPSVIKHFIDNGVRE